MAKKLKSDFVLTPERKQHYKDLEIWLKSVGIPYKKLVIGLSVNISDIPKQHVDKWIEKATFIN